MLSWNDGGAHRAPHLEYSRLCGIRNWMSPPPSPSPSWICHPERRPPKPRDLREAIRPRGVRAVALSPAKGLREAISSSHETGTHGSRVRSLRDKFSREDIMPI